MSGGFEMYCPNCGLVYRKDRAQPKGWHGGQFVCLFCLNVWDKGADHVLVTVQKPEE